MFSEELIIPTTNTMRYLYYNYFFTVQILFNSYYNTKILFKEKLVRLRLALPAGCTLAEEAPDEAGMLGPRGVRILRDGETVGRIECGGFANPELSGWPPENPREIYAF